MNAYGRAALAGLATGGRTFSALSLLVARPRRGDPLPKRLTSSAARHIVTTSAWGEVIGDKLPMTPSRTAPPSLAGRIATAALCGFVLGRRAGVAPARTVALSAAAAASWSFGGVRYRAVAAKALGSDLPGALLEDVAAYAAARAAFA
ncbi:hypothetical protein [uncultured Jatrophihabitans sp.]|uniref:hypothetical protein n=1 Tax=uncultured Jatrophihabitans sp. TaxID=1610747 RepID=UPI0035C9F408